MKDFITGGRLPTFTPDEQALLKGSSDFIGLNHYTSRYVKSVATPGIDWNSDSRTAKSPTDVNGTVIGPKGESGWLYVYPQGLRGILNWIDQRYSSPGTKQTVIVFENGASVPNETKMAIGDAVKDTFRINFYKSYIQNMIELLAA